MARHCSARHNVAQSPTNPPWSAHDRPDAPALHPLPLALRNAAAHHGRPQVLLRELLGRVGLRTPGSAPGGQRPPVRHHVRPLPAGGPHGHAIRNGCRARAGISFAEIFTVIGVIRTTILISARVESPPERAWRLSQGKVLDPPAQRLGGEMRARPRQLPPGAGPPQTLPLAGDTLRRTIPL